MTEREALLRAVLANPADDLPRLVYADWLEENGQAERAVFIRCHVEEEGLRHTHRHGHPGGCRKCKLVRRVCRWVESDGGGKAVFRDTFEYLVGAVWYGGRSVIADPADARSTELEFVRGLGGHVCCTVAGWMLFGERAVARHPIERVTLNDREPMASLNGRFTWVSADDGGPHHLRPEETSYLIPTDWCRRPFAALGYFDSRETATAALSLRAVDVMRHRNGLPLLTAPASPAPNAKAVGR